MMLDIEGKLTIRLHLSPDRDIAADIDSTRPVYASKLFQGKTVDEALKLLPTVFSICGAAQACAGVQACEQALGIPASTVTQQQRAMRVNLETVREHVWRVLMDWPELCGHHADAPALRQIISLLQQMSASGANDIFSPGATVSSASSKQDSSVLNSLHESIDQTIFGISNAQWLGITTETDLKCWADTVDTPATEMIRQIVSRQWQGVGACAVASLPIIADEALHRLLQQRSFIARPVWQQQCWETTCLTRTRSPLLDELRLAYRNGLLPRLVARITELALLLQNPTASEMSEYRSSRAPHLAGAGLSQVEAARGRLLHRVKIHRGQIEKYQILAPTEWNFHPEGVVSQALAALSGTPHEIAQQARLLINAIDPCVGYELLLNREQPDHA